jgi:hypothetical protein
MSNYRGLFTFDEQNHKYTPIALADGIIDLLDTTDYVPTEPLIKDEKIRKAVRAWAEVININQDNIKVSIGSHMTSIIGWKPG